MTILLVGDQGRRRARRGWHVRRDCPPTRRPPRRLPRERRIPVRPRAAQPGPPLPPDRLRPPAAGDHPPGRRSRLSLRCFIDDDELSPIMGIERLAARATADHGRSKSRPSRPISSDVVVNTSWGLRISSYPRVSPGISPGISRYPAISRHIPPQIPRKESASLGMSGVILHLRL